MLKPALSKLGEEAATVFMSTVGRSASIRGFAKKVVDSEMGRDLEAYVAKRFEPPPFKTSDDIKLFRSPEGEPRRLSFDRDFRIKGGVASYRTLNDGAVHLEIPSLRELQHAPTDELTDLVRQNQGQLVKAVEAAPPSELPKLGWHGTSHEGANFLWDTKTSQAYKSGKDAPLWFMSVDGEAKSASQYLNDIQTSMEPTRGMYPGSTSANGPVDKLRHEIFVLDTSKTETWRWDFNANEYRQGTFDPDLVRFWTRQNDHLGAPAQKVGRQFATVIPENYNDTVFGSFVNSPLTTKLDVPRNYFDRDKYERLNLVDILGLQEDTAQTLDLSGVLRRLK